MATRHVALAYLVGFACLGPECEDTCCAGWTITVDEEHHQKLRARMAQLGELATFKERMKRPPGARSAERFAIIGQRPDATCTFLEADRRCEIHRRHGEDHLPDACATFPRQVSRVGERVELSASVACPEIARRALLVDGATDLVPCDASVAGRGIAAQQLDPAARLPYLTSLDRVRGAMFAVLRRREHAMRSRLFFVAELAERIGAFMVDETEAVPDGRLDAEIARIEAPETLAALEGHLASAQVSPELGPAVVMQVISERLRGPAPAVFRRLFGELLRRLAREDGGVTLTHDDVDSASVSPVPLAAYHAAHRDAREARFGDRLDLFLENYARNWVMRDWYISAPDLATHVQRLFVRLAILRFLLLHDPRLDTATDLDALAVEVFYATSRALDHAQGPVHEAIAKHLAEVPTLAAAVALVRV